MSNQYVKAVEKHSRRIAIRVGDIIPDHKDQMLFREVLCMRVALYEDLLRQAWNETHSPCQTPAATLSEHAKRSLLSLQRTLASLKEIDVELYTKDWKILREVITSLPAQFAANESFDADRVALGFKRQCAKRIHYKWITNSAAALLEEGGSNWFFRLNQWSVFDAKINFASLDLSLSCCTEYLDFERRLHEEQKVQASEDVDLPSLGVYSKSALQYLARRSAKDLLGDFCIRDYAFSGQHGPGSTYEIGRADASRYTKNRYFRYDSELAIYLDYRLGHDWRSAFFYPQKGLKRICELVCVPKSTMKNRTISKEPVMLQYLQQDVKNALDDYFQKHLNDKIRLHDQGRSRRLAQEGSKSGSYATIDLSAASDSVTVTTVEQMFDGLPILYPLLATRSTHVNVHTKDGTTINTVVEMEKFAPMGSATCFPVECCVFMVICECAVRLSTGRRSKSNDFCVYGDDIVIRSEYAQATIDLLHYWGFTVNADKSFANTAGHFFREACGVECLDGEVITPLRLSRGLTSFQMEDDVRNSAIASGQIDLVNTAYLYGYKSLRNLLNTWLTNKWWYYYIQRVGVGDWAEFENSVMNSRPIRPFFGSVYFIVDQGTATNFRCYSRKDHRYMRVALREKMNLQTRCAVFASAKSRRVDFVALYGGINPRKISTRRARNSENYLFCVLSEMDRRDRRSLDDVESPEDRRRVEVPFEERHFSPFGSGDQAWSKALVQIS